MATQQDLQAFFSPKAKEKRPREMVNPSDVTSPSEKSPEVKIIRPNETSTKSSAEDDKQRKARGRNAEVQHTKGEKEEKTNEVVTTNKERQKRKDKGQGNNGHGLMKEKEKETEKNEGVKQMDKKTEIEAQEEEVEDPVKEKPTMRKTFAEVAKENT